MNRPKLLTSYQTWLGWLAAFGLIGWLVLTSTAATGQNAPTDDPDFDEEIPLDEDAAQESEDTAEEEGLDAIWEKYDPDKKSMQNITTVVRIEDIVESTSEYTYSSFGKQDPFVPPMINELIARLEIPITSPLQRFPLASLKVTGLWTLPSGESKALVVTADDTGIISQVGDPIGRKGGKIIAIDDKKITVREFTPSPDGTRQFSDIEMPLGRIAQSDDEEDRIVINTKRPADESSASDKGFLDQTESEEARINQRASAIYDGIDKESAKALQQDESVQRALPPGLPLPQVPVGSLPAQLPNGLPIQPAQEGVPQAQ